MNQLILVGFLAVAFVLIRRDTASRTGVSAASWIPTLWVGIIASRPMSAWLGVGSGVDTLEGSPIDRLFFFILMFAAWAVLMRRRVDWATFCSRNWPVVLFYLYLLFSVLWANSPLSSFRRWTKEIGNILVVLVILTEADPIQTLREIFVRCAYVLIPLSIIFIRYFPSLGRTYNIHSGEMEATGVTFQKNSLGAMLLVCGLILFWDWLERSRPDAPVRSRLERYAAPVVLGIAVWLFWLSDSKTSMTAWALSAGIVAAVRLPVLHRRISALGIYGICAAVAFFVVDQQFGISRWIVAGLGRDMTFTGRTEVWEQLLNLRTDPVFGTGFMSLWDDAHYRALLPDWVAFSAHNGYLEIYLAGGIVGIALLGLMLIVTGFRINQALATTQDYAVVRFAIFVAALIANTMESNFACMTPVGFLFLVAACGDLQPLMLPNPVRATAEAFGATRRFAPRTS